MNVSNRNILCVENICRTCMTNENKLIPLFNSFLKDIQDKNLAEILKICTNLKVEQNDGLPSHICENCTKQLNIAYTFKCQSTEIDATLREMIKSTNTNILEIKEEILDCCESILNYQKDTEVNLSDDDQNFEESVEEKDENFAQINKKKKKMPKINHIEYFCELCSKKFKLKRNLVLHKKKCEKLKTSSPESSDKDESYDCKKCWKTFLTKNEFSIHGKLDCTSLEIENCNEKILEKDNKFNYFCEKCGKTYTKRSFLSHKKINCAQIFECEECNLEFSSRKELRVHCKNHKPLLKCKMCPKMFRSSYGLDYHSKRHEGVENYSCPFENCTKKFAIKRALDKHILIHSKDSSYLCYKCGQSFTTSDALYYHIKTHDGRSPHLCTFCGKTFKQTCHLKNHMWIHTGIKPYECDKCKKRFTRLKSLKKHKLKHCHVLANENIEIIKTDS